MLVLLLLVVGGRVELLVPCILTPHPNTAKPLCHPSLLQSGSEALTPRTVARQDGRRPRWFSVEVLAPRLAYLEMVASPEHTFLTLSH